MKGRFLLFLIAAVITCLTTLAQPVVKRQTVIGAYGEDAFMSMDVTRDKGLIVGGYTSSRKAGYPLRFNNAVTKLDSSARVQWSKVIGGDNDDVLTAVQQTRDGGYILGGRSSSNKSGDKSEDRMGLSDFWIVRLDSRGNVRWDKTIGGNNIDWLIALQQTNDNGFILGGSSNSNVSNDKSENSRGDYDYWIVKLDSVGNIIWDKTIGGNHTDNLHALEQTADKGFVLGGYSNSDKSGEKTGNDRGDDDYWVVKLDSLGNIQWDRTIGGSDHDGLLTLKQTSDAGFILGGESYSNISGEKTENSRGKWDYWVVKLNTEGIIQWDKTIGGSDGDILYSVQETIDGGYILGGVSGSDISGEKTENKKSTNNYTYDYWVVKLDQDGKFVWDKTIGGDYDDLLGNIKEISKNHFLIGGSSDSGIWADKTLASKGSYDIWLVELEYNPVTNIRTTLLNNNLQITAKNKSFTIYPNPAKDILHIQTPGKASLSFTNQSGKVLLTKTIEGKGAINVAALPAGLYYLKNTSTGEVQKVIVTK